MILSHDWVWLDKRFGNWIHLTLTPVTANKYNNITELHNKDHCNYSMHKVFSVFTSRCLVATSNRGRSPSPRNRVAQLYPQALGSLFVASYDSQGYGGGIRTRLHAGMSTQSESELLYEWRFTANHFVLTPSPLRLMARFLFSTAHLASGPAGTHGHIFVQCQDICFFFFSLILLIDKGGVGLLYRMVFTYYT
jgi:hypothetical protein